MIEWKWDGAHWWKFDFHTHTPASDDYGRGQNQGALNNRTPKEWLIDYMQAGIDCVAITDHNSGAWIDRLKDALAELAHENHVNYRPIHLFPGVEISVNGGIHVLAILGCEKRTSDIDSLLGAVGYSGCKGSSDTVTTKSFTEVVRSIVAAGGIAIPAHVYADHGLFKQTGTTLCQALDSGNVFAMEGGAGASQKPQSYLDKKHCWTEVIGSDAHHPSANPGLTCPGCRFTWVKMGSPSIEGLQLALLDGPLSVLCSDGTTGDPNGHAAMVLEAIEVDHARYIGRSQPLSVKFSPWLSAIIGGRGTGKSTLIEFLRLSLRRESDLPDELKPEFEKYGRVYPNREDGGLLTSETKIRAIYHKHGTRFRVQWSPDGSQHPIEEERDQAWVRAEGDIKQRFPVRICSQKEIFQLAKNSHALLNIVDATPEVDYISWREKWHEEESRYLALRAMVREIETGLAEEPRLRGELDDVKRKLSIFEQAGHSDVLKTYQRRRRQQQSIDAWERSWNGTGDRLRHVAANIVPDHLDETAFDGISAQELELREYAAKTRNQLDAVRMTIEASAIQAELICVNWRKTIEGSLWKAATDIAARAYQDLQAKLTQEGAGDTNAYGEYVQRRQTLEQRLKNMDDRKTQVAVILSQIEVILSRLLNLRRQITASRKQFLDQVLSDNKYVRIGVVPYGARETVETELRKLLQREGGGFEKDIGTPDTEGVLGELYKRVSSADDFEKRLADIKKWIRSKASNTDVSSDVADQRFAKHLAKLQPEALDRLDLWYPRDSLDVQYCTSGDRQCFRPIQEGSPGQKTAALLAFLLSYGEEPLILDQPEDDLDNHLIYDLIVMQLREVKRQRQVIVVTHNANIVVNGDAELVIALAVRGGQTQIESAGSLQEKSVRENICTIMEGGRTAFDQRYRRIALEGRHV